MRFLENFTWIHVLLTGLVIGGLVGLAVYFGLPGRYAASSSILLEEQADLLAAVSGDDGADGPSLERIEAILLSRAMRERVAEELSLAEKLDVSQTEAIDSLSEMVTFSRIGQDGLTIEITVDGYAAPRVAMRGYPLTFEQARQMCSEIANAYPDKLGDYLREIALARAREGQELLARRHQTLRAELEESRDGLQSLRARYELLDPDSRAARLGDRIRALEQDYATASAEADAASKALGEAEQQLSTVDATRIASAVETRNPLIDRLEQELVELNSELATELASGKTAEHRTVVQLQSAIDSIRDQLAEIQERVLRDVGEQPNPLYDDTVRRVVDLRVQLAGAQARRAETGSLLREARARMSEMPTVAREYVEIGAREETASERLAAIERALWAAEFEEARAETTSSFRILDTALPPEERRGPPAVLAGSITCVALVLLLGLLIIDRRWFAG